MFMGLYVVVENGFDVYLYAGEKYCIACILSKSSDLVIGLNYVTFNTQNILEYFYNILWLS